MFYNRKDAGFRLAERLKEYNLSTAVVFAIPRGGVVVGAEIAERLNISLELLVVKKLGAPQNSELAVGAVAPEGVYYIDGKLAVTLGITQEMLDKLIPEKQKEVREREKLYKIKSPKDLSGKTVLLTDDGVATGATILAAIRYVKSRKPEKTIVAVPVIAFDAYEEIKSRADKLIVLEIPQSFNAVGQFYEDFPQVSDEEVIKLLHATNGRIGQITK